MSGYGKERKKKIGHRVEGNTLRFSYGGLVYVNKKVDARQTEVELTIGLGKEGVPFGGWINYTKILMQRLIRVIMIVWLETQTEGISLSMREEIRGRLLRLQEEVNAIEYRDMG